MDLKTLETEYITLVPQDSSVGSGAQTILAGGSLKRRRLHNAEDDKLNNVRVKL